MNMPPTQAPHVVLAGGSGFIGRSLTRHLLRQGYRVTNLTRGQAHVDEHGATHLTWDGRHVGPWAVALDGAAGLINLAGRNVNCRYTPAHKREILQSRLDAVVALDQAMARCDQPPPVWVQAATLAIHGHRGDEPITEDSPTHAPPLPTSPDAIARVPGRTFSPVVARAWEEAVLQANSTHRRKVILRISFALGDDGPLPLLARLARWGLGGSVGTGRQHYSWIHIHDLCRIMQMAVERPDMQGVYNATSPQPERNARFMALLRQAVGRPWSPPASTPMIHLGCWLMRSEPELALRSRHGVPHRLTHEAGFVFDHPALAGALHDLLGRR